MTDYTPLSDLKVTRSHILNCSFSHWYPLFKDVTPRAEIFKPVPAEFVTFLNQDGIQLVEEHKQNSFYTGNVVQDDSNDYSDWENDIEETELNDDDDNNNQLLKNDQIINPLTHFPEFHGKLKDTIAEFGSVTPKLNWSAPRDATWIIPNNVMKCQEVNEIYLLLNASNYIAHDLENAFDECIDNDTTDSTKDIEFELVLREWFDLNPALEFRVFVENKKIIGVSQRDLNYYDYLSNLSDTFKDLIDEFVEDTINVKFNDNSYVLDIYIPRPFNKCYLIDINPFARKTDPLLFSWNELLTMKETLSNDMDYALRLVKENNPARFATMEHSENHVPKDIVEASLDPNAIRELTEKWKELLSKQLQDESSSDDEV